MLKSMAVELVGGELRTDAPGAPGVWYLPEEARRAADGLRALAEAAGASVRVGPHDLEVRLTAVQRAFRSTWPYVVTFSWPAAVGRCAGHLAQDLAAGGLHTFKLRLFARPAPGGLELGSWEWLPGDPLTLPPAAHPRDCDVCKGHRWTAAFHAHEAAIGPRALRAHHEELARMAAARAF